MKKILDIPQCQRDSHTTSRLGYQADGRTLAIEETEAATIQTIADLYRHHETIRRVAECTDRLGLRTRLIEDSDGHPKGGNPFSRGHIYAILANPVYAGRIWHKDQVHDGQHLAIIEPETWAKVQILPEKEAVKKRGTKQPAKHVSSKRTSATLLGLVHVPICSLGR